MDITRGFIIATSLSLILLAIAIIGIFFYLKRKYSSIENKINVLFKLVQDEAVKSQEQKNIVYTENINQGQYQVTGQNTEQIDETRNTLIEVSDDSDEDSLLDEDNSDIESTVIDDCEEENKVIKNVELQDTENTDVNDILSININKLNINENNDEQDNDDEQSSEDEQDNEEINDKESQLSYHSNEDTDEDKIKKNISYLHSNNYKKMNVSSLRETIQYLDLPNIGNIKQTKKKDLLDMIDAYINKYEVKEEKITFNVNDLFNNSKDTQEQDVLISGPDEVQDNIEENTDDNNKDEVEQEEVDKENEENTNEDNVNDEETNDVGENYELQGDIEELDLVSDDNEL